MKTRRWLIGLGVGVIALAILASVVLPSMLPLPHLEPRDIARIHISYRSLTDETQKVDVTDRATIKAVCGLLNRVLNHKPARMAFWAIRANLTLVRHDGKQLTMVLFAEPEDPHQRFGPMAIGGRYYHDSGQTLAGLHAILGLRD